MASLRWGGAVNVGPDRMVALGLWLGYPACCVLNFRDRMQRWLRGEEVEEGLKLDGTGFVPCPKCNETKSEEELRREIASNRICPIPFPEYDL